MKTLLVVLASVLLLPTFTVAQGFQNCANCPLTFCQRQQSEGALVCINDCFWIDGQCYVVCELIGECIFGSVTKGQQPALESDKKACGTPKALEAPGSALLKNYPWLNHGEMQGGKLMLSGTSNDRFHQLLQAYELSALKRGVYDYVRLAMTDKAGNRVAVTVQTGSEGTQTLSFFVDTSKVGRTFEDFVRAEHPEPVETLVISQKSWEWKSSAGGEDSGQIK